MAMLTGWHCHILMLTVNYNRSVPAKARAEKGICSVTVQPRLSCCFAGIRKGERHGRKEKYPYL